MSKRFLIVLAACVVLFGGLLVFSKRDNETANDNSSNNNKATTLSEHKTEAGSTGVTLVEYGDFQCPACYQFYPIIKQVKEKYKGQITFQFRHYPLTEIHQNALISARAAEAASLQDRFWEMHDKLYEGQPTWSTNNNPSQTFEDYAAQLGLNVDKFRQDMRSEAVNGVVQADRAEARKQGYSSTPTFILDGKKIENPEATLDFFTKLVDDAIKAKQTG